MPEAFVQAWVGAMVFALRQGELLAQGDAPSEATKRRAPWVVPLAEGWRTLSPWKLCWRGLWEAEEHINIQEMRTASLVARRLARDRRNWGGRHLLFVDNLVVLACLRRMRSRSVPLLRLVRRIAAITLSTGLRLIVR